MINRGCWTWTGQMSSQARHVQQDHNSSERMTEPCRLGSSPLARREVRSNRASKACTRSRGESGKPVLNPGHSSWHFPHQVHASTWSNCRQVKSFSVRTPDSTATGSLPGGVVAAEKDVQRRGEDVERLGEGDGQDEGEGQDRVQPPDAPVQGADRLQLQRRQGLRQA